MKEGIGSFKFPTRGRTGLIYVPSVVASDSTFPFKKGEAVKIRIESERLIVERVKE